MSPDFSKKVIDTIAKRAAYICTNPDCRVHTIGPNDDADKATSIGEAAHISGARQTSARYEASQTDFSRASITNAIWLCRNCHKLIDADAALYPRDLLLAWKETHDEFVANSLGNQSDKMRFAQGLAETDQFEQYPPLIRRIAKDKEDGWEWRLTSELLKHLNAAPLRKLCDLRDGLYTKEVQVIEPGSVENWLSRRLTEMEELATPIERILDRLNPAWGEQEEQGDTDEIHHLCLLLRDALVRIVANEEAIKFARPPEEYQVPHAMLLDVLGSQADKLGTVPQALDNALAMIGTDHGGTAETPTVVEHILVFDVPPKWSKNFTAAMKKAKR